MGVARRLLVAVLALHAALSRPIRRLDSAIGALRSELKADIAGLDDRVYALAVGLRPQLHQREGSESGGAAGSTG